MEGVSESESTIYQHIIEEETAKLEAAESQYEIEAIAKEIETRIEGTAAAVEEVKAFVNKIKTDFGSELHLKQLSEEDLISGIANIKDSAIKEIVMKKIRSYEGAIKYNNVNTKVEADALEAEVAAAVSNSCEVTEFAKPIDPPGLPRAGEIDVATSKYIIEVTIGDSSKEASEFAKYFIEPINPNSERGVILYAPKISDENATSIESVGVKVIRNIYDLIKYIKG